MSNYTQSPLSTYEALSPNHSGKRTHAIDRITPHCFVGQVTAERGCEVFLPKSKQASCNYVIGHNGKIGTSVKEENRSWCSSSAANDQRAITIECASDTTAPYAFTDACYNSLVNLCEDICKRYNKTRLVWIDDKKTALAYKPAENEMLLTVHRWFAAKSCPGDWMYSRMGNLASAVTARLAASEAGITKSYTLYRVQVGAYRQKANADAMYKKLKECGFDAYIKSEVVQNE